MPIGSVLNGVIPNYGMGNLGTGTGFLNFGNIGAQAAMNPNAFEGASTISKTANGGLFNNLFGSSSGGILGGLSQLGGLATGIMQGLAGFQQLGLANKAYNLAKQQFGFQKALANRNLANQAKIINNTYDNAAQVAAGMIGGQDANGNFGFTDPNVVRQYANRAKKQHVNGSAI